jgi:hypothetical protein
VTAGTATLGSTDVNAESAWIDIDPAAGHVFISPRHDQ